MSGNDLNLMDLFDEDGKEGGDDLGGEAELGDGELGDGEVLDAGTGDDDSEVGGDPFDWVGEGEFGSLGGQRVLRDPNAHSLSEWRREQMKAANSRKKHLLSSASGESSSGERPPMAKKGRIGANPPKVGAQSADIGASAFQRPTGGGEEGEVRTVSKPAADSRESAVVEEQEMRYICEVRSAK